MKILVCGSRHFDDWMLLDKTLYIHAPWYVDEENYTLTIIEGGAIGADFLSRAWGKKNGALIEEYPADWNKHGKAAGPIRNKQMLDEGKPDLVIAFLAKDSRGTANMIKQAKDANIPVEIINIRSVK